MNRNGSVHKTAAVYQVNEFVPRHGPSFENMGSQQCDNSQGEVQLACGCMLPIVAGAFSPGRQKLGQWPAQIMPCASVN